MEEQGARETLLGPGAGHSPKLRTEDVMGRGAERPLVSTVLYIHR